MCGFFLYFSILPFNLLALSVSLNVLPGCLYACTGSILRHCPALAYIRRHCPALAAVVSVVRRGVEPRPVILIQFIRYGSPQPSTVHVHTTVGARIYDMCCQEKEARANRIHERQPTLQAQIISNGHIRNSSSVTVH